MHRIGYDDKTFVLRDEQGNEVPMLQEIVSFRGEHMTLMGGEAPHKDNSSGRVHTNVGSFYPSVFNLRWEELV